MNVVEAPYRSTLWNEFLKLRYEVLRQPLGLMYTEDDLAQESIDLTLVLVAPEVKAGLMLRGMGTDLKMRQVAVSPDAQGRGVGKFLVGVSEKVGLELGYERIVLNARETAVPFYLACGYTAEGDVFQEVGIPHRFMFKNLK